ncbi:MAG: hypothetical protein NDJ89_16090 [Oligoflexia bacterium]|nr:hypothetical protein [Oligoflexia bacterium]
MNSESSLPLSGNSRAEIRRCLDLDPEKTPTSLETLIRQLVSENGETAKPYLKFKNVHLRLPSGEKRRLHLFSDSGPDGKPVLRLRIFSEDTEGLPVPLPVSPDLMINPAPERMLALEAEGTRELSEEALSLRTPSQMIDWTVRNGRITQLFWVGRERSLGCALSDHEECDCRD